MVKEWKESRFAPLGRYATQSAIVNWLVIFHAVSLLRNISTPESSAPDEEIYDILTIHRLLQDMAL
jgi:hypothetical protein